MTTEEQIAESIKYSSAFVWHFAEISPGVFVLYNHERKVILITNNWLKILRAYRDRPVYVPPAPKPEVDTSLIDTSKIRITL